MIRHAWNFLVLLVACSSAQGAPAKQSDLQGTPARTASVASNRIGKPDASGVIYAARVVAAVDDGPATDHPIYARADQTVTLYAVIEVEDRGHDGRPYRLFYTDAPHLSIGGHRVETLAIMSAPAAELTWHRVEPVGQTYSNTDGGTFHFTEIEYKSTEIVGAAGKSSLAADVRPTLTPDHGNGVGTMRFQVVVNQSGAEIASPGPEARRGRGSGGLTDAVMRVSIRRDDSYLGYLTEMFGQPYVWASAGLSDKSHQSERLEGSDCADFVVYGARRMGKSIAYTWTGGLPQITNLLAAGTRGEDGVYRDAKGTPLPFTHAGDLILFPRHVGALVEDRGTLGVLDDQDIMMHTLFDSPKQQPIADSGYADKPVELRRFR